VAGLRVEEGFVGYHDRAAGMPIPVHISVRAEDLEVYCRRTQFLDESDSDPVLMVTLIAFGFVFIHPFEDGNGRIHRYLFGIACLCVSITVEERC